MGLILHLVSTSIYFVQNLRPAQQICGKIQTKMHPY